MATPAATEVTAGRTILHIGADKTGTTAVQGAMAGHRAELVERGLWYPDLDGRPDHRCLADRRPGPALTVPDGVDTVLLSSEALWPLRPKRIERLLDWLPTGEITVLGYVRRPVDHAEAAFGQRLRLSRSERELRVLHAVAQVPAAVNPIVARALRRLRQLERWADVVDDQANRGTRGRLAVRAYAPSADPHWDVVVDLCAALDLDRVVPLLAGRADPRPNPTPNLVALHASVLVREAAGPQAQGRFLEAVAARRPGQADGPGPWSPRPLLPAGLRRHLRRRTDPVLAHLDARLGGLGSLLDDGEPIGTNDDPVGAAPSLDRGRARALLAEVWPAFPAGAPPG